jgi:hypothetical protein
MLALLADKESERSLDGASDDYGDQTAPSEQTSEPQLVSLTNLTFVVCCLLFHLRRFTRLFRLF